MMKTPLSRGALAVLPWIAAALVWFGFVSPLRAGQEARLSQQSRIRSERVKAERGLNETRTVRERIRRALGEACRVSPDPAALRQRTVAASAGLPLSPFSLTVTGGPQGGATVDASGTRSATLELLRRLGDPARGSFLRGVSIREKGGSWTVSVVTGLFEPLPGSIIPALLSCSEVSDPLPGGGAALPFQDSRRSRSPGPSRPLVAPPAPFDTASPTPAVEPAETAPFTLVAFLASGGRSRVSIRVGDVVRVVSVGDTVDGWKCVSIDRDEGVVFASPLRGRVVLRAGPSQR